MLSLKKQPGQEQNTARQRCDRGTGFCVRVLLGLLLASPALAQKVEIIDVALIPTPEEICQLFAADYQGNHYFRVADPLATAGKTATATFDVTYSGFTPEAEAAFQRAVDTWSTLLTSSETIYVSAGWVGMAPTVLGSAGPNGALSLSGFPDGINRAVGRPLAEALLSTNTNGTGADINANFNSNFADWHFGTGAPPPGLVDFESVVLHELGHGLNFIRFADVGTGCGAATDGCMDLDPSAGLLYGINDVEYIDGSAVSLRNTGTYPDPGTDLGTALTGGFSGVFFDGSVATATHGSAPPLYAPSTFAAGSSLSHLDTSFDGTLSALMTPSISYGEVARTPGPVTCALFTDLGWSVDLGTCNNLPLPVELIAFEATTDAADGLLTWSTASETNNAGFEIQSLSKIVGATPGPPDPWQVLGFVNGHGTTLEEQAYTYRTTALEPGRHVFRLKQIDFDGTFEYSPEVEVVVELPSDFALSSAYPNPFNPETQVLLTVATAQRVLVEVYDAVGRRVARLYDGEMAAAERYRFTFDARHRPSGLYFIRATGKTFSALTPAMLVR